MKYSHLFQKGYIGNIEVKNRIVMAPMGTPGLTGYAGTFSDRAIDYYERRASGGIGLIITGLNLVSSKIEPWEVDGQTSNVTFDALWKVRNFYSLTERVHDYGAKIFAQLTAGFGRVFPSSLLHSLGDQGKQAIAPSSTPLFWDPTLSAREIREEEIELLIQAFGKAAVIAKESEFDGIELHGHEGYLMDQFTSALWNKRSDKYGGDLLGRMNFIVSIINTIREKVGSSFPIIYRYGIDHKIPGGRTAEESIELAKILEQLGVSALHVDAGCYDKWYWPHPPIYQPPACMVDMAEKVKPHVKIPIITVGRLGYPDVADRIIQERKADFIALGRPLLADPDFAIKARKGGTGTIRPCIGCHECLDRIRKQRSISCAVNPQCGDERRLDISPTLAPREIMVVGGGIAGMEAARVCGLRGHHVTLYEKSNRLGGLLNIASKADFKQDLLYLLRYQIEQLRTIPNIKIRMGMEVTENVVRAVKRDVVFLATGSVPVIEGSIDGLERTVFVTPDQVYEGNIPVGSKASIIGGGSVGCETAIFLAKNNWSVVLAEMLPVVASDLLKPNQEMLYDLLKENGVEVLVQTEIRRVKPGKVFVTSPDGERAINVDLIVLATGRRPANDLLVVSEALGEEVYAIGDCVSPRRIKDAMWEAFKFAKIV
jgi:2-enoate reductase